MRSHVEVLARAARAVHGPGEIAGKLEWVTEEARSLTKASFVAFVGLGARVAMICVSGASLGGAARGSCAVAASARDLTGSASRGRHSGRCAGSPGRRGPALSAPNPGGGPFCAPT